MKDVKDVIRDAVMAATGGTLDIGNVTSETLSALDAAGYAVVRKVTTPAMEAAYYICEPLDELSPLNAPSPQAALTAMLQASQSDTGREG